MKTVKQMLLTIAVLLCSAAVNAHDFEVDGIFYNILDETEKTAEVTYKGSSSGEYENEYTGSVVIPASVTYSDVTYSVTTIGNNAFRGCSGLTSVTIPNSVTTIGNNAFRGCSGLTSITIPNSVTTIGELAFTSCSGLASIVVEEVNSHYDSRDNCNAIIETSTNTLIAGCMNTSIPNSVTTIGGYAFYYCRGLTSVTIPNGVTTIGNDAFYCCSGLTSITIPNSVTTIGNYAFHYCSGLTSITIPNSVTTIGEGAFRGCSGLASIVVEEENSHYDSRDNCNAIIETSTNTLIAGCKNTSIPNSVTTIGEAAFQYCGGLTSVTIPNSVTTIGSSAFEGCSGLTSITIPNSVTTIGEGAFWDCSGLTSITIPNSVTTIEHGAFGYCSGLTSVTIPNSVTSIGDDAFYKCSALTSVYVESLTPATIGSATFSNIPSNATLYVPMGAKAAYEAAKYWSKFTNIVEYENVKSFNLTVSSVGYASMYLDYPVAIPEGVEVYTADRVEGDLLKMEEVTGVIPANTGVIIRAAEGTYTFTESDETPATIETNLLKGTVTDTYIAPASKEKHYVLSVVDDVVGMYRPKLNGEGKFLNNANKAYMVLTGLNVDGDDDLDTGNPGTQLSNGYRFDFSGTTAIEEVVTESTTVVPVYYDLSGRRVENPTKGIYILNGKKVLVK